MTTITSDLTRLSGRPALAISIVLLAACGQTFDVEMQELESIRTSWAAGSPSSYEMEFTMRCYCEHDGLKQSALICDGELRSGNFSLESILDLTDMAIAEGDKSLQVQVDSKTGYPAVIRFGSELGFDSEVQFLIEQIRPLDEQSIASCTAQ